MLSAKLKQLAALMAGCLVCAMAHSQDSFATTSQEAALCKAVLYGGKDSRAIVASEPGVGWEHTHHWCDCVRFRYRAIKAIGNKGAVGHNLTEAISGCDYVIAHANPSFRALPKIHVDKGRALKMQGNTGAAAQEFQWAMERDPTEVNAYFEMAGLQRGLGNKRDAMETVTLGLRHNPDAKALQKLYLELGGKEPFPEPIVKAAPEVKPPEPKAEAPQSKPDEPVVTVDLAPGGEGGAAQAPADGGAAEGEHAGRACRFCPPDEIQRRWVESFSAKQKKPE